MCAKKRTYVPGILSKVHAHYQKVDAGTNTNRDHLTFVNWTRREHALTGHIVDSDTHKTDTQYFFMIEILGNTKNTYGTIAFLTSVSITNSIARPLTYLRWSKSIVKGHIAKT